jgi:uncharacterized repeat protein (TIGR01451 family)
VLSGVDNKKLTGFCRLLVNILFAGSVLLCLTANTLRRTLLSAPVNRFTRAAVAVAASLFAGIPARVFNNRNELVPGCVPADGGFRRTQINAGLSRSRSGFSLLLFVLLMSAASFARAGEFCSADPFFGTIDGSNPTHLADLGTQITIDTDCTFINFPAGNELTVTLNFQTTDDSIYLITFDNVIFTGNMACANIDHRIWFVNGADFGSNKNCQDLFIPVEAINKQNPAGTTTVGIGEPFTYTLTIPVLYDPATGTFLDSFGSANDLHSITITDDLNATGANLTLVGTPTITWLSGANAGNAVPHSFSNVGGLLTFEIDPASNPGIIIPSGDQLQIAITVVADDTNAVGTQFVNTARWSFGRLINIDLDGDGIAEPNFFDPLPGENGISEPLTIGAPDLVVTKTSPDTALNVGVQATFTVDVQNNGGTDAWNATIVDELPDGVFTGKPAGMCDFNPADPNNDLNFADSTITARVFAADGITAVSPVLVQGVDFSVTHTGSPQCELVFTMLTDVTAIGSTERLIITYQSQLNTDTTADGAALTNVAGATEWFSGDGSYPRTTFSRSLTDGTPATLDHEDSHTITTSLSGYVFQKTVQNLTTGANPATTAAPGDILRYQLRLFNVDQAINNVTVTDTLDGTVFDLTSVTNITVSAGGDFNYDSGTGILDIVGNPPPLNVAVTTELVVEFDVTLLPGLANSTPVLNQATLNAVGITNILSDDPNINGIADPTNLPYNPDQTLVVIQSPGPLRKGLSQPTATVGEQFVYTITVPAIPLDLPLYDVRILDDLTVSNADMTFVSASVVAGGAWTLTNTGSATNLVIEDTGSGIDIPANGQAKIEVTVQLENTATNVDGLLFNNTASYTYNRAC